MIKQPEDKKIGDLLNAVIESSGEGILVVDRQERILVSNSQVMELWGIPDNVASSKDDNVLLKFAMEQVIDPHQFINKVQDIYKTCQSSCDDIYLKDGRVLERHASPLLLNQEIAGCIWIFRDISRQKAIEKRIREHQESLETLVEERTADLLRSNEELKKEIIERRKVEKLIRIGRDLSTSLSSTTSLEKAFKIILEAIREAVDADFFAIYRIDRETGDFTMMSEIGLSDKFKEAVKFVSHDSYHLKYTFKEYPIHGTLEELGVPPEFPGYQEGLGEVAYIPVKLGESIIAHICLASKHQKRFTDLEMAFLESTASKIGFEIDQIETKASLEYERKQLKAVFDSVGVFIYVADINTYEIRFLNKYAQDMVGKESVGKKCYQVLQHLDAPCEFCTNEILKKKKDQPHQWEYHNPVFDRDYLIIERMFTWPDGREVRFHVALDITEQKQTEDELRKSEEMYRSVFESSLNGIEILDLQGNIIDINPATYKMHEYPSKEEFLAQPIDKIIHPDSMDEFRVFLEKLNRGENFRCEVKNQKKNGETLYIDGFATPFNHEGERRILTVLQDITARKQTENLLRAERDMLDMITQNIGAGMVIISKEYRIVWCNQIFKEMYGNVVSKRCYKVLNHKKSPCKECGPKKVFANRCSIAALEQKSFDRDGKEVWARMISTPIKSKQDVIISALELVVPITEIKEMEAKLLRSERKLRALSQNLIQSIEDERGKLVRELHDQMGKQVTMLSLELESLLYDKEIKKEQIENLHSKVLITSEELRSICKGLAPLNLNDTGLKTALYNLIYEYLDVSTLKIKLLIDNIFPTAIDDDVAVSVYRIIQEALTNVIRHSNADNVKVTVQEEDGSIVFEIQDDGKGFTPEQSVSNRGLGLLGMKERAALYGGHVEIHSSPAGTVVQGAIPLKGQNSQ